MNSYIVWLIFIIASVLIEILVSPGLFYFLALSLGAAGAAAAAWYNFDLLTQALIFVCGSVVAFVLLRQFIKQISKDTLHKSNVYALQGKKAVVTETISSCKKGWVKVEGELWAAVAINDAMIEKGALVEVVSSAGSHLKVKRIQGHC